MPVVLEVKFLYCGIPVAPTPVLRVVELVIAFGAEEIMGLTLEEVMTEVLPENVSECSKG